MKDFVEAFDNQMSRAQIKYLITKLEEEKLINKTGNKRTTLYKLHEDIDVEQNITKQFVEQLLRQ